MLTPFGYDILALVGKTSQASLIQVGSFTLPIFSGDRFTSERDGIISQADASLSY